MVCLTEGSEDNVILIVDDDIEQLHFMSNVLGNVGYKVRPVTNAAIALSELHTEIPSLIILSQNFGDLSRIDLCCEIKKSTALEPIPVVFISEQNDIDTKLKAFEVGAVDYLLKPIQGEELVIRVANHLKMTCLQNEILKRSVILQKERDEHKKTSDELRLYKKHLESLVDKRTSEISAANEELKQEISNRKNIELSLQKQTRSYRALCDYLHTLSHASDESQLIQKVCDIIHSDCKYPLVWVGFACDDEDRSIECMAWAGKYDAFAPSVKLSWGDNEYGLYPSGAAIRTGKIVINKSSLSNPTYKDWHDQARKERFLSSISLPIAMMDNMIGVLSIYSHEERDFENDEVGLWLELANDLAFGILSLRMKKEREIAENALRESEARYRLLFQKCNDAIFLIDLTDDRILEVNEVASKFTGLSRGDLLNLYFDDLFLKDDSDDASLLEGELMRDRGSISERWLFAKDGKKILLEINSHSIFYKGKLVVMSIGRDITERRESELEILKSKEKAEVANKAKSTFIARMSHEIRTPLSGIIGFSELLLMMNLGSLSGEQLDFIQRISRSSKHMLELVDDFLDLSMIELGRINLKMRQISLGEVIDGAVSDITAMAKEKGVCLELDYHSSKLGHILADRSRIIQILLNLLTNAIKFTPQKGLVGISATGDDKEVIITVWDTGVGICSDKQDKIFNEFEKVSHHSQKDSKGVGLGLAIVKKLVNLHNGDIFVESAEDEGSRFTVKLPRRIEMRVQDSEPLVENSKDQCKHSLSEKRTFLLVEDDDSNRLLMRKVLEMNSIDVIEADCGKSGLKIAGSNSPHVILLDIGLPDMSGVDVFMKLRGDPDTAHIPAIAVTAYAGENDRAIFNQVGFNGCIPKPIDTVTFLKQIEEILS